MTVTSNEEFAKRTMLLAAPAEPFKPSAAYDPDGDCIEFLASPDPFYAERVDNLVTVYYSQETGEVIGSLLKGVSKFCTALLVKMPGFQIEIQDRRAKLRHIFLARLWSSQHAPRDLPTLTYKKLIAIAEGTEVEGDLCSTCGSASDSISSAETPGRSLAVRGRTCLQHLARQDRRARPLRDFIVTTLAPAS